MRTLQNKLLRTVSSETFFSDRDSYYYKVTELLMLKSSQFSAQSPVSRESSTVESLFIYIS